MAEIELNRETIQFLIDRAREFHTRDDVSFDEEPDIDDDDWSQQVASFVSDPYYQEIKTTIEDLEPGPHTVELTGQSDTCHEFY